MEQKPREPSKEFQKHEEKIRQDEIAVAGAAEAEKQVIYWSPASKCQLANFRKEVRSGGHIMQPEESLTFSNHILATTDPEIIEFIEGKKEGDNWVKKPQNSFKNGLIKKCKNIEEARMFTMQRRQMRQIKEIHSTVGGPDGGTDRIKKVVGAG